MNRPALFLALAFAVLQGVALTDCACGAACLRPGEHCPAEPKGCCGEEEPAEGAPCTHVEPSADVIPADPPSPETAVASAPLPSPSLPPPEEPVIVVSAGWNSRGDPPLYLLHHVFRR